MKRKFTLIGCYDDERWLIYQVKPSQFVMVNPFSEEYMVEPNWVSPLKWVDYFMFISVSVYDEKSREIIEKNIDDINNILDEMDKEKPNRKLIRLMANIRKNAEPNEHIT